MGVLNAGLTYDIKVNVSVDKFNRRIFLAGNKVSVSVDKFLTGN
jgi:hypothetical protein